MWLLNFLRWLAPRQLLDIRLFLGWGGELEPAYRAVVPSLRCGRRASLVERAVRRFHRDFDLTLLTLPLDGVDVIYANTVATLRTLLALQARRACPAVCHVHELEMAIARHCGDETFRRAVPHVSRFVAASRPVAEHLRLREVPASRIRPIDECIPLPHLAGAAALGARTRRELGIPEGAFVVGGCGSIDWRKGPEIFLLAAKRAVAAGRPVHFVWVGGDGDFVRAQLAHDVRRLGLEGRVHLVGATAEPRRFFAAFDAFFLSSREDPLPLVALEAAAHGVPVVCFAGAGGAADLVAADAGFAVPYLDVDGAAERLLFLAGDEEARVRLGARAQEKVRAGHDLEVVAPRIVEVLDELSDPRGAASA